MAKTDLPEKLLNYLQAWLDESGWIKEVNVEEIIRCCKAEPKMREALEKHRWIPVSERPPTLKPQSHHSRWVIVANTKQWTIARYNHQYKDWNPGNSSYNLDMNTITHWKPIILPEQAREGKN